MTDTQDGDGGVALDGDEVAGNDRTTEVVVGRERLAMKGPGSGRCGYASRVETASLSLLIARHEAWRTIRKHKQGVLAAVELGLSNARLEALNSKVRLISHRAYGFHSADALIAMIYLCCAGIQIDLPHR